ncbi:hypothetical protein LAZ67_3005848 [Cordylochernes scorpioides]|uniref:Integrase catalytic domain-containing protein n=1 Tax=Cordylochernes scorpioides TaxID=51811 RepID=A0ABY6KAM6_9ARAC|nr:hypothetical protein LAZ67_3005848 [Cordylochernes scorpioides]
MNKLREKYWIVKARQTIKKIVRRCVTCRRFSAKPVVVEDAPLPATRVHNAKVFEVVGIDLAGPLYLKDQTKTWVVLFTCAVYRCVHLELVISLSTEDFLMALERFIKRRGRPSTIFSDNGTNFVGANNFFKKIDWERVSNDGKVKRIEWKFIPPTAAWWGGWWERLIRSLKDILKRMLGTSTLTYQQLMTLLCHAEAVMNGRPMTYVSDDPNDLVTISPSMFLQEQTEVEFPECQNMGSNPTTKKLRYLSKLREELKSRFRKEYLSLLVQRNRRIYNPKLQAGDVVLVGMDNKKRNFWPLAVIEEILFGRDGVNRLVKVGVCVEWWRSIIPDAAQAAQTAQVSAVNMPAVPAANINIRTRLGLLPTSRVFVALTRKQRHLATEIGLGLPHPVREWIRPTAGRQSKYPPTNQGRVGPVGRRSPTMDSCKKKKKANKPSQPSVDITALVEEDNMVISRHYQILQSLGQPSLAALHLDLVASLISERK